MIQFSTIKILIYIRHSIDTSDKKFIELNDLMDEINPEIEEAQNKVLDSIIHHILKKEIEEKYGSLII